MLCSFSMIILRHSHIGGNPWLLCSFSMITTASFPRRRESMVAVLVLHDNTASFPRRRESMVAVLVLHDNTGHSRVGGNPWLLCSFSMIILRHSRLRGNPPLQDASRRESRIRHNFPCGSSVFHVPNARSFHSCRFVKPTGPNCQTFVRCSHTRFFRLLVTFV